MRRLKKKKMALIGAPIILITVILGIVANLSLADLDKTYVCESNYWQDKDTIVYDVSGYFRDINTLNKTIDIKHTIIDEQGKKYTCRRGEWIKICDWVQLNTNTTCEEYKKGMR